MVCLDEIKNLAKLARLETDDKSAEEFLVGVSKMLTMMNVLVDTDTDDVLPLTNVHDMTQPLRDDVVDAQNLAVDRMQNQAMAPSVLDGLYLVPQVIE